MSRRDFRTIRDRPEEPGGQAALDRVAWESLRPVAAAMGLYYLAMAANHLLVLPADVARIMVPLALGSSLLALLLLAAVRAWSLPPGRAHALLTALGAVILVNSLFHIYLAGEPRQTTHLMIVVMAGGLVLLSSRWLALFLSASLAGWGLVVSQLPASTEWQHFGFALLSATVLAILGHAIRRQSLQRLETLRRQDARRKEELERRTVQLETSIGVSQHIMSILELDTLLAQVAELIQERYGYAYVGILLLDEERDELVGRAGTGSPGQVMREQGLRIEVGQGISGWVAQHRQPACIEDVDRDDRFLCWELMPQTRSEMALPLKLGERLLGVLDIQSEEIGAFREEDLPVLQQLADQVAISMENARLYEQIRRFSQELEVTVAERTEALQKAYDELEQLDRARSDFIEISSHELRTPLTVLSGYGQMLLHDAAVAGNPHLKRVVAGIYDGTRRLQDIVESMLDMVKIDNGTLTVYASPLLLGRILESVAQEFEAALAERTLDLSYEGLAGLPPIEADFECTEKIFYHLLANAIKYTPDGGWITVEGQQITDPTGAEAVEVVVSDSGIGVDPAARELIFAKFYQGGPVDLHSTSKTRFKGGGPGLGLAIVRGMVEAHGGRVWVESAGFDEETCPGSQFHVVLPLRQPPPGGSETFAVSSD
jgi:signal transduction histidine kinase